MISLKSYKAYLFIVYAFLLALHVVLKDRFYPLSILFYMTPIIIIIGFGFVLSYIVRKQKKRHYIALITTFALVIYWLGTAYGWTEKVIESDGKYLVFWNIADQQFLPRPFFETHITNRKPEVIALVETKQISVSDLKYLHEKFPEYDIQILKGHMIIAVKGEIISTQQHFFKTHSKFNLITYKTKQQETSLLIVDVSSNPFQNRDHDLKTILEFCQTNDVDFILGDFNTPYESVHFNAYKDTYKSFHNVSHGFTATWPYGFPLLELDQIWISKTNDVLSLEKKYSPYSDHALLLGRFQFNRE